MAKLEDHWLQEHCPTTSNRRSRLVAMITVSLWGPPKVAGRPFTVALFTALSGGMRSFTCNSLGAPGLASSTVETTLFVAGFAARLKFTRPQRVGAWSMRISFPAATHS